MQKNKLHHIRREYQRDYLDESQMSENPYNQFEIWMKQAVENIPDDATAMVLSTVSMEGRPSSRIVLLKDYSPVGFTYFTNYFYSAYFRILLNEEEGRKD